MAEMPGMRGRVWKAFWVVLGAVFLTELAVMYVLHWLRLGLPWWQVALIDTAILSLTVSGTVYWAVARPYGETAPAPDSRPFRQQGGREAAIAGLYPVKTFGLLVLAIFVINTAVLGLLEMRAPVAGENGWGEALSHGVFATLPIAGAVWWLVVGPLRRAVRRLEHAAGKSARVARRLRESEEHYRILFESSWDAIMTLEPPSWKFTSANQATLDMFGAESEAGFTMLGPWEVSPPVQPDGRPSSEKAAEMIGIAMREGAHYFDWTHKRLNGASFPATVLLTRVERRGRTFLQATVRDVSAEVAAREALDRANAELAVKNRQLEAANRSKAEFLAAVSHEMRTPLNVILGFADALEADDAGRLGAQQAEYLREIRGAGEELLQVVNAILDMSSLDAEKPADAHELAEVEGLLRDAVEAQRESARRRGIEIIVEAEAGSGRTVCNPRALRKALNQLLSNAVKFNRDQGRVTVSLRRGAGGTIEIAVADNGIGIAAQDMPRLFQPFVQLDASHARRYGGIGIGLALVRRLSEACGGSVSAESEPGKGSVFTLRLPVGAAGSETAAAGNQSAAVR